MRFAYATVLLWGVGLWGGCACSEFCARRLSQCVDSCNRRFDHRRDPDGWNYCMSDCSATYDGCEYRCETEEQEDGASTP